MQVDIILPTYNSARFLDAQIESIVGQRHQDWCLYIRDDGSSDQTCTLIADWASRDHRIHCLKTTNGHLGLSLGLRELLAATTSPWVFFADHDDVWLDNKLARMLAVAMEKGVLNSMSFPVLLHSDLVVVDANLDIIAPSLWRFLGIERQSNHIFSLLRRNRVTGCAAMINRCLVDLLLSTLHEKLVHDWWIAQLASLEGRIVSLPEQLVLYRQHDANQIGAVPAGLAKLPVLLNAARLSAYRLSLFSALGHLKSVSHSGRAVAMIRPVLFWEIIKRQTLYNILGFFEWLSTQ